MKRCRKIKITFPALIMACALLLSKDRTIALAVFCAASIHEIGHILAAAALEIKIKSFSLDLLGAKLHTDDPYLSYWKEILLSLAGPLANIYSLIIVLPPILRGYKISDFYMAFTLASLGLCVFNLLPLSDFDGGRILYCAIAGIKGPLLAQKIIRYSSFFLLLTIWFFSVYVLLKCAKSISAFAFCAGLFVNLFFSRESED